ncbi:hypothetical protein ACP275_01G110600 [Erythranthe tilingii]
MYSSCLFHFYSNIYNVILIYHFIIYFLLLRLTSSLTYPTPNFSFLFFVLHSATSRPQSLFFFFNFLPFLPGKHHLPHLLMFLFVFSPSLRFTSSSFLLGLVFSSAHRSSHSQLRPRSDRPRQSPAQIRPAR